MKPNHKDNQILDRASLKMLTLIAICIALTSLAFSVKNAEYRPIGINVPARALNTAYSPSVSRYVLVSCSVFITSNLSLAGGQSGTITLSTSPDGVTYTVVATATNNNTGTLTVGLNTSQAQAGTLVATVPPGGYYKFVSTGNSTFSLLSTQETFL